MLARIPKRAVKLVAQNAGKSILSTTATTVRSVASKPSAIHSVAPAVLEKARKIAPPVGLVAGLFGSIVGVGGGVVIVPAIVSACKTIPQRLVSGTSLAAVLSTAIASAATFAQAGCIDMAAAAVVSPMAMLTAPLGARLTSRLNCTSLRKILGYFLLCVAPLVPLKAYLLSRKESSSLGDAPILQEDGKKNDDVSSAASPSLTTSATPLVKINSNSATKEAAREDEEKEKANFSSFISSSSLFSFFASSPSQQRLEHQQQQQPQQQLFASIEAMGMPKILLLATTGSIAGLASGLLGIGGGTIVTPLLALTLSSGQATVLGTSLAAMVPPSAAALVQHAKLGNVDWRMAVGLAVGTAVGGAVGSSVAVQAPSGALEVCFAVGMLFLGRKTLQSIK